MYLNYAIFRHENIFLAVLHWVCTMYWWGTTPEVCHVYSQNQLQSYCEYSIMFENIFHCVLGPTDNGRSLTTNQGDWFNP